MDFPPFTSSHILPCNNRICKTRYVRGVGLRVALIAAVISLPDMTATPVSVGVRIISDGHEVIQFDQFLLGYNRFPPRTTVEYELKPQEVSLPLGWTEELTKAWKSFGYDYHHFTGVELKTQLGASAEPGQLLLPIIVHAAAACGLSADSVEF